nr:PREDICTED: N-alpha-acetyltransferase 20-like isoform X2 [Apteryx mantelli mantelli]
MFLNQALLVRDPLLPAVSGPLARVFHCRGSTRWRANGLQKGGFFVDLFVRVSNQVAVNMYKQLGYSVYRTVLEYYSASNGEPDEDAYGEYLFRF